MRFKLPAEFGRAAVLPDDRPVERPARAAIPQDDGLPLVGNADRGDLFRGDSSAANRLSDDDQSGIPDFLRVMLDPSGPGEILAEFAIGL